MDAWPDHVRDALTQRLISCGKLLADPRVFCRPRIEDARNWDSLIDAWANEDRLPLFVRYNGKQAVRGSTIGHADGRNLIFVDNSPAHWAWSKATMGDCPDIESLASSMKDGCDRSIPLAFILTGAESKDDGNQSSTTALAGVAGKDFLLGARGLKLAHIDAVRLAGKGPIEHRRLDDLKQHFKPVVSG